MKIKLEDIVSEVELTVCFTKDFLWPVDSLLLDEAGMKGNPVDGTSKASESTVEVSSMPTVIDGVNTESLEVLAAGNTSLIFDLEGVWRV